MISLTHRGSQNESINFSGRSLCQSASNISATSTGPQNSVGSIQLQQTIAVPAMSPPWQTLELNAALMLSSYVAHCCQNGAFLLRSVVLVASEMFLGE